LPKKASSYHFSEKQVFRILRDNRFAQDIIALRHEPINGASLLGLRMSEGKCLKEPEGFSKIRERFQGDFAALDSSFKTLHGPPAYVTVHSPLPQGHLPY
jgi:hypothetical protein